MKISDMYMAAAFLAYGAELVNVDRENPTRQVFEFGGKIKHIFILSDNQILRVDAPSFEDVKIKFIGRSLCYPPEYADTLRRMKSIIHGM